MSPVRVLVVDDSAFVRSVLSRNLSEDPEIVIAGTASDGEEALRAVRDLRPDVITLDVVMPRLDGLAALKRIMVEHPTPVVMVSSLTGEDTQATVEALALGAVDFFQKGAAGSLTWRKEELRAKVKTAAQSKVGALRLPLQSPAGGLPYARKRHSNKFANVVVLGCSTGGPRALRELVPMLSPDLSAAFLIVQHMPAGFTASLAQGLDKLSRVAVKEAVAGDVLGRGEAILAPGGFHLRVTSEGVVVLDDGPQVHGVKPAVDITMESVVSAYGKAAIGVVMTGMGSDGTDGAGLIKRAGGCVAAEDESTCTIYGMPKSVVKAGYADAVIPLNKIPEWLAKVCGTIPALLTAAGRH